MDTKHPFAIASPSKSQGFAIGENQRVVTVTPAGPICFQVNINNKPVGRPCNRESAVQLARTLDPTFTMPRSESFPLHSLHGGRPALASNSVVRSHTRTGPDGRPMQVRAFYREQTRNKTGGHHPADDLEKAMLEHDDARFRTKNPDEFRAHSASLTALGASERATEQGDERWHEAAAQAHQQAVELWEIVGDKDHARRHQRAADFHARQVRSAGGYAANSEPILAGNAVANWIG